VLALCASGVSLAGNYSWSQPAEFTGANPEQKYGQPSWSYSGGSFSSDGPNLVMSANAGQPVTLTWTNPFGQPNGIAISGSISFPVGSICAGWSLTDSNGQTLASGLGVVGGSLSSGDTLASGGAVHLTVSAVAVGCTADVSMGSPPPPRLSP
jgi:hypothetical protein